MKELSRGHTDPTFWESAEVREARAKRVAKTQEEIRRMREAIFAKVRPEVEAEWEEVAARQSQDAAEQAAVVEVNRERRLRAQAMEDAPSSAIQENREMAIDTTTEKKAQPGQRKKSAHQRIQSEMAAAGARTKRTAKKTNGKPVAAAPVRKNGEHGVVEENKAAAKKDGVRIKLWMKGAQSGKPTPVYQVYVVGTRLFAISGNIDSLAEAKAACKAAGFEVKSLPESPAKKK